MANARTSSSESGFAIIEVIASAAVLAIVALAVLAGIDGATASSAREKARAVASGLAEQDQERLRAMSVLTLKAVPQVPPITVDGVSYTIKSDAGFITDDTGGTPSCGNSSSNSEYFHITSTVTSSVVGVRIPPVKIDSLVSPSVAYAQGHGTIGAKIVDATGKGIAGIDVTGTGPSTLASQKTDQDGCVIWRSVNVGSYTIKVNVSGYCDENGATDVTRQQSVSPNNVAFVNFAYDRCASATVSVRTHVPGQAFSTTSIRQSRAREISDVGSNTTLKTWTASPPPSAASFVPSNLFPYPSKPYGFFTGKCQYENPEKLGLANYFTNTNSGASMIANPTTAGQAFVYQPPINMRVTGSRSGTVPSPGTMEVHLTLIKPSAFGTDTCADQKFVYNVMDWPSTWGATTGAGGTIAATGKGWVTQSTTEYDPGLPFGTYSICLLDKAQSTIRGYKPAATYDNTTASGVTTANSVNISETGSSFWSSSTTC